MVSESCPKFSRANRLRLSSASSAIENPTKFLGDYNLQGLPLRRIEFLVHHFCSSMLLKTSIFNPVPTTTPPLRPPLFSSSPSRANLTENIAIEGRNLTFSITTRQGKIVPILRDCSLRIPSGQFWMLLGPNGCGKSTLLKVLAGLLNASTGAVYVKKPKCFVFQNPDYQVVMPTVEADVAFGLGKLNLTNEEVKSRVLEALSSVGMSSYLQRSVQTLSGGQKQRVAIAGALAEACKVLLLDELTTFLDEKDQMGVIKAVRSSLHNSEDVSALWVTHRLEELEYADGAIYMEDGKVIMHGDVESVQSFIKMKQSDYIKRIYYS
ncbi:ABC transporter I family member 10 [Cucurbita maxima]|uniref:ABC transporter I family member 10 n=1 Tax=Cucurbita maxima TaxID=3661 RepID=A0A6J1IEA4_CUCMA|nr:ABC transporter I family member 10 [Cucurbita maxima]